MGLTFDQVMDGANAGYQTGKQIWEGAGLPAAPPTTKGKSRSFSYARAQVAPLPMSMQLAGPPTLDDLSIGRITVGPGVAYGGGGGGSYGGGGSATNGEILGLEIDPKLLYAGAALLLLFLFAKRRKKKG
jgi:hypothetical protein